LLTLGLLVLLHSQIPGELEPFEQLLRRCFRQADVRRALPAPTAGDGEEHVRGLVDERLLQLRGEHQVPKPEMLVGEGREDAAADAEVGSPHVSALLGVVEAEGDLPEVVRGHETDLSGRGLAFHLLSSLDRGQHIRIAGQEPAAVGLFAVDRHTITGKPTFLSAGAWGHGE
jgi:hypothetical protein